MGTSEAAGFVDDKNRLWGWLNELAFVPVDMNENAAVDEWSGDIGTGVKYLSQDGVIKLASLAGIEFQTGVPSERLKVVQNLLDEGSEVAATVFRTSAYILRTRFYTITIFINLKTYCRWGAL
ncbi:MAG: hypothetical protein L6V82_04720 [Clostridiales bacterium]|nr:MAG: hypothetical protein L6V82_04720 [Clostridiales bacterium]